jgi:drug/metabolite transporter (DMT)-like permease
MPEPFPPFAPTALPTLSVCSDLPRLPYGGATAVEPSASASSSTASLLLRRVLAVVCVLGMPITNTAQAEYGQYIETRLEGGPYKHGYAISWLNHSVLIVFLIPWIAIVVAEKGCSCVALWRAMAGPYGSGKRLGGVTFWLAFQYQLINYAYWSWLPFTSPSSAQTLAQSQCIFAVLFAGAILKEPIPLLRGLLVLLCVAGVCILTYGDMRHHHGGTGGSASSSVDLYSAGSGSDGDSEQNGSMLGDVLLIIPNAFSALYAVEWKRLVPGAQARDSLLGLGM